MTNTTNDQIKFARACITRANRGDSHAAKEVLEQAVVGLRDVLNGQCPDLERVEYLRYLVAATEQILQGAPVSKALGIWTGGRSHSVSPDRDLKIFMAVGLKHDQLKKTKKTRITGRARIRRAQESISKDYEVGLETVRKAWEFFGGLRGWQYSIRE